MRRTVMDCKLLYACLVLCRHYIIALATKPVPQRTWDNASVFCRQNGGFLPIDGTTEDHRKLVHQMQEVGITSTWLGIKKTRYPTWIWVDGQPAAKTTCSALGVPLGDCVETQGRVFIYGCDSNNWYDARLRCEQKSGHLALMRSESIMAVLRQKWYRDNRRPCEKLWMGLRREDWDFPGASGKGKSVMQNYWQRNQPGDRGSCAIISNDTSGHSYRWSTASCNSYKHAMCMYPEEPSTTLTDSEAVVTKETTNVVLQRTTENYTGRSHYNPNEGNGKIAAGVIVPLLLVIVVGVIGFYVYHKRKHLKRQTDKTEQEGDERIWLNDPKIDQQNDDTEQAEGEIQRLNDTKIDQKEQTYQSASETNEQSAISDAAAACTFRFTRDGGHYQVPESNVFIEIPNDSVGDNQMYDGTLEIEGHMKPKYYNLNKGEKMISPFVMFDIPETLFKHVAIHISHGIHNSSRDFTKHIKTYEWIATNDQWEPIANSNNSEGDIYSINEDSEVIIFTKRSTQFLCTCDVSMLGATDFSALIIVNYREDHDLQEVTFHVYLLDSMYAREECITTLPGEHIHIFEYITLLPSALPPETEYDNLILGVELDIDKAWDFVELFEGKNQHIQVKVFTKIMPSQDNPVGQEIAKFITRRKEEAPRKEILKYKCRLTLSDRERKHDDENQITRTYGEHEGRLDLSHINLDDRESE